MISVLISSQCIRITFQNLMIILDWEIFII